MLTETAKVLKKGDASGNGMPFRLRLKTGLEIAGLPTMNFYGGEWDLGPTWNYLIMAERPFLIDAGRTGTGKILLEMMELVGFKPKDLEFILLSHGHEDHDGGLVEIANETGARIMAHHVYSRLIQFYPENTPAGAREDFPASCWHCFMPEEFSRKYCFDYHQERSRLKIMELGDSKTELESGIFIRHLPGHSPDALAVQLGSEAILVGDTVLPEITPIPSREAFFEQAKGILPPRPNGKSGYGLRTYIRSLKRLRTIGLKYPGMLVLPGHRLFSRGKWNEIELVKRTEELLHHHLDRCGDILRIIEASPKTARQIAKEHFDQRLLKGFGINMAENEVLSHCEFLVASGDITVQGDGIYKATGSRKFPSLMSSLEPWDNQG